MVFLNFVLRASDFRSVPCYNPCGLIFLFSCMSRVVFAGTAEFALPTLIELAKKHDVLHVFSQPNRPVGRKQVEERTPVARLCSQLKLACSQPEKIEEDSFWGNPPKFDFLITASFGQILPEKLLSAPSVDSLNVHGSLLPKYRGASPIQNALLAGETVTGISVIRMVKKMDAGDVFLQQEVAIQDDDTYETLHERLSHVGASVLLKTVENYASLRPMPQDGSEATYCRKIRRTDGEIYFESPAQDIYNMWRAFTPWPGIFTFFQGKRLKLLSVRPERDSHNAEHGLVYRKNNKTFVACRGKSALEILEVQLEGKKPIKIDEFLKGQKGFVGVVLD